MAALRTEKYKRYIIIKLIIIIIIIIITIIIIIIIVIIIIIIIIIIITIMAVQTSGWPEEKNKSFGWEANRDQPQHPLKFVVPITQ